MEVPEFLDDVIQEDTVGIVTAKKVHTWNRVQLVLNRWRTASSFSDFLRKVSAVVD